MREESRAGRAGRTQSGVCVRLWDEPSHRARPEQTVPEIRRVDLCAAVLQLIALGEPDVRKFPWLDAPTDDAVQQSLALLEQLGFLHNGALTVLGEAAALPRPTDLFDADDPRFLAPGDMPGRIADWFAEHGMRGPASPAGTVRVIIESLAQAFADTVRRAAELSGVPVDTIHIVGGGARNSLLCQATADRSGLPVLAGPVEATALGNALVQARAVGLIDGDLETLRALVARHYAPVRYEPSR